ARAPRPAAPGGSGDAYRGGRGGGGGRGPRRPRPRAGGPPPRGFFLGARRAGWGAPWRRGRRGRPPTGPPPPWPPCCRPPPLDASRLLNFVRYLVGDGARGEEIWAWAEAVAGPFVQHAPALSLLGVLGDVLRCSANRRLAELIPTERVEGLLRQSLDLDPDN